MTLTLTRVWFRHSMRHPRIQRAGALAFCNALQEAGFGVLEARNGRQVFRPGPTYFTRSLEEFAAEW